MSVVLLNMDDESPSKTNDNEPLNQDSVLNLLMVPLVQKQARVNHLKSRSNLTVLEIIKLLRSRVHFFYLFNLIEDYELEKKMARQKEGEFNKLTHRVLGGDSLGIKKKQ